ncbi:LysR family transcriptional regulator [Vibrio amylolyticus]|uniref:LysR family transcriptional regulator n=1 Tax=Vibrio amylolyticus TaxID=2847292 RepID=UPI00354EF987
MDRLTAIRSFIEVAHCGSFTRAAERIGLSRLQVSRHVGEVENWLEQRLLHRTTRKVSLTSSGEAALKRCEKILYETSLLELNAQNKTPYLSGALKIAAPIGLTQNILLDATEKFITLHPNVTVEFFASDSFAQLVDERIDIALRYTNQPDESLIARKLMKIDAVICASNAYLEERGEPTEVEELTKHNCFLHLDSSTWEFTKDNQQKSVDISGNIKANDIGVLSLAAQHGKGIVRLPCDLANPLIREHKLTRILADYSAPSSVLWAVYLSRSYQLPVVRQFIDFLANEWSEDIEESQLAR